MKNPINSIILQLIKNIFGRVYALYALLLFVISMLVVVIPVRMNMGIKDDRKRTAAILTILRRWMAFYLPAIFCPVRKKGLEYFKKDQNYVVVFNHNSLMDVPVSSPSVPGANKTLAKAEIAKTPVFGMIYKCGSVLVDRSSMESRRRSYEDMKKVLEQGMHLSLYPEGTRNKTAEPLKPFYDGAFNIAIDTQKPVIPALIFHTREILPPGKAFYAWPHAIRLHFLEPVPTTGMTLKDAPALKEKVFNRMKEYYMTHK